MIILNISGNPVPWAAHQGYGRRAYNPRGHDRNRIQEELKKQFNLAPLSGPVSVSYHFYLPIPKSFPKKQSVRFHVKKPDVSNLIKFAEDTLKGIVILDDNQVCDIWAQKSYSDLPKTIIHINPLQGDFCERVRDTI